jgi:coenzyme F420-0:L-glutamate ligase/coenzyme F420-1:gamma-L-glutamate ligase
MTLLLTPLASIPLIRMGDDLPGIILSAMQQAGLQFADNDIVVLTSKIISKAEARMVDLKSVIPSEKACQLAIKSEKDPRLVELILRESNEVLRIRSGTIIVEHRLGFVCASAGIDQSNISSRELAEEPGDDQGDWVLLLPENPDISAADIRNRLETTSGKRIGVMIIDSHGRAWRLGIVGTCVGLSGIPGIIDKRGDPDLFGYRLRITQIAAADELAAAASLVMGQADEATPVIHVRGFPYPLREGSMAELLRPIEQDMFR